MQDPDIFKELELVNTTSSSSVSHTIPRADFSAPTNVLGQCWIDVLFSIYTDILN